MGLGGILLLSRNEQLENGLTNHPEKDAVLGIFSRSVCSAPVGPPYIFSVPLLTWSGLAPSQWSGLLYTEPLGSCGLANSSREPLEYFSDYNHRNAGAITVMTAASLAMAFCQRFVKHVKCNCT